MLTLLSKRLRFNIKCNLVKKYVVPANTDNNVDPKIMYELKKHLRNQRLLFKDGPTCLLMECHLCDNMSGSEAYVNKRTGLLLCPNCDVKKNVADVLHLYEKNCRGDAKCKDVDYKTKFKDLQSVSQIVCDNLGIRGLKSTDLEYLGAQYEPNLNCLHFPIKNVANKVVGEKIMYLSDRREETIENYNHSGLVLSIAAQKSSRVVLVSNLVDFIILSMQRLDNSSINCMFALWS